MALRRPDLVDRLVFAAGVFHYDGWLPGVIDPAREPPQFLADSYAELSPDGPATTSDCRQGHPDAPGRPSLTSPNSAHRRPHARDDR